MTTLSYFEKVPRGGAEQWNIEILRAEAFGAAPSTGDGTSGGVATASAVGSSTTTAAGTSAGAATASGVGRATSSAVGSAAGVATASASAFVDANIWAYAGTVALAPLAPPAVAVLLTGPATSSVNGPITAEVVP